MENLINKIFKKEKWLDYKEVKPFFETFGFIPTSNDFPAYFSQREFKDINGKLIKNERGEIYIKISGIYRTYAPPNSWDRNYPKGFVDYKFNIIDGKLKFEKDIFHKPSEIK